MSGKRRKSSGCGAGRDARRRHRTRPYNRVSRHRRGGDAPSATPVSWRPSPHGSGFRAPRPNRVRRRQACSSAVLSSAISPRGERPWATPTPRAQVRGISQQRRTLLTSARLTARHMAPCRAPPIMCPKRASDPPLKSTKPTDLEGISRIGRDLHEAQVLKLPDLPGDLRGMDILRAGDRRGADSRPREGLA